MSSGLLFSNVTKNPKESVLNDFGSPPSQANERMGLIYTLHWYSRSNCVGGINMLWLFL